jgi:catalase
MININRYSTTMTTDLENLTGEGWKETFLGGNSETEAEILKKYAQDIHLVQERNRKKSGGSRAQRALHAKIHAGITNAELHIDTNIPQFLQHGIFQPGKTYKAYVRLSNASGVVQADSKRDLRGLAIRVFSNDSEGKERINDLLMTSAPVSHARDVRQFMKFASEASTRPAILFPVRLVFAVGLTETVRMFWNIIKYSSQQAGSLAKQTFWSRGPFQLGQAALQFHARPVSCTPEAKKGKTDNYLREDLVERLSKSDVSFDIMAQLFVNEQKTPIEDGAVLWQESDSPPFKIAQLILPKQYLGDNQALDTEAFLQPTKNHPLKLI